MFTKIKYGLPVLVTGLVLFTTTSALAAHVVVDGDGVSTQAALRNAFRVAVEQQLGVLVDAKTLVANNTLVNDNIVTHSDGFVASYDVRSSSTTSTGVHLVVDVDVVDSLKATVTDVLAARRLVDVNLGSPRVALVVVDGTGRPLPLDAFVDKLHAAGFDRVVAFGNGDLLLTGCVVSESIGPCTSPGFDGWFSARTTIAARLVDGTELAESWTPTGIGLDITQAGALEQARNRALAVLADGLVVKLKSTSAKVGQRVTINAHGFTAGDAQRLVDGLVGVNQSFVRSVNNGVVVVDANVDRSPAELAVELEASYVVRLNNRTLEVSRR